MMKNSLLLFFVALVTTLQAQVTNWEVGAFLGTANYQGDVVEPVTYTLKETNIAFGAFLRRNFNDNVSLRLNIYQGAITGDDANFTEPDWREKRAFNFNSPLTEVGLNLEYDILGGLRTKNNGKFRRIISPYIFGGVGMTFFNPKVDFSANTLTSLDNRIDVDRNADYQKNTIVVPFGAGIKIDISEMSVLGGEFGMRPAFTDYLDGISESANPDLSDWYSFAGLNLAIRVGIKDTDKDGISDKEDKCPEEAGILEAGGCPDSDLDGIKDTEDNCPDVPGLRAMNGCPDTDRDGIIDGEDSCPNEKGLASMNGCPDADGDGIIDGEDACPTEVGIREKNGCPVRDADSDGIEDDVDECPNQYGSAASGGCPVLDDDGDGIPNADDRCPNIAGASAFSGCPDTDGDGVEDGLDRCPTTAGTSTNAGCPELTVEEKEVLNFAMRSIRFETSKSTMKAESFNILDQVVDIMRKYPDYYLRMTGYTDSVGNDFANQQLSERRAQACYNYLIREGIDGSRLSYQGLGENNPIGDNNTADGRRLNRRVEFEIFLQ